MSSPDSHVQHLLGIYRYSMGKKKQEKRMKQSIENLQISNTSDLPIIHHPQNFTSSYINFMSCVAPPATNHLKQKLKKSHPRMLALTWPHMQLVRRYFRLCLKKHFWIWSFSTSSLPLPSFQALIISHMGLCSNLSSPPFLSSWLQQAKLPKMQIQSRPSLA